MAEKALRCYTVGHSVNEVETFIALLRQHGIDCIVDVRSSPYSRFASQFNRESLAIALRLAGIAYLYLGDRLGARYEEASLLFEDGKVDFEAVQRTKQFQEGIERLVEGMKKGYGISLMCSEKEPFDCHRFVLVSKTLQDRGVEVGHITADGLVMNRVLEERLFEKYKRPRHDLFHSEEENLEAVYRLRNRDIAYNALTKEGDEE